MVEVLKVDITFGRVRAAFALDAVPKRDEFQVPIGANDTCARRKPVGRATTITDLAKVCHAIIARFIYMHMKGMSHSVNR